LEKVRRTARGVFGYESRIYRIAAFGLTQYHILRRESWATMWRLIMIDREPRGVEVELVVHSLQAPIVVRVGTDDVPTVVNNAVREDYGQFPGEFSPKVIIDAGAYIGDTSAYFLSRFPSSRVVALEPNEDSFPLASRNLRPYGDRVSLVNAALWTEVTTVRFNGQQTGAAIGNQGVEVPTVSIASLMAQYNLEFIDLLKIDIEGAEVQVLPAGVGGWLNKVGTICLETHGREVEEQLIPLLNEAGFSCERFRTIWYCTSAHRRANGS
jgi:FkbM family methyltransferase